MHFVVTILQTLPLKIVTQIFYKILKYNINLRHETSLGPNSFHLASEHDHVYILRILMSSKLCDWTSSFEKALYLSAKKGHVRVVMYLLSINAIDNCVPCFNFIYSSRRENQDFRLTYLFRIYQTNAITRTSF